MTKANAIDWTLTGEGDRAVNTRAAGPETLSADLRDRESNRRAWQEVIDKKLIEWGRDPSQLDDEMVIAPTRDVIRVAVELALALRDHDCPPPGRVIPDGDGGILFERTDGVHTETLEVLDDSSIEYAAFQGSRLMARRPIM